MEQALAVCVRDVFPSGQIDIDPVARRVRVGLTKTEVVELGADGVWRYQLYPPWEHTAIRIDAAADHQTHSIQSRIGGRTVVEALGRLGDTCMLGFGQQSLGIQYRVVRRMEVYTWDSE